MEGNVMKKMKVFICISLLITFAFVCLSLAVDYKYVGSSKSNKYHYPNCQWALKIKPKNLVTFKTAKEAQAAGYIPCKVCKPPITD